MKNGIRLALTTVVLLGMLSTLSMAKTREAGQILETTGIKGGLVVHIGSGDGKLTAALCVNDRYVVHGLDDDPANIFGPLVFTVRFRLSGLKATVCLTPITL